MFVHQIYLNIVTAGIISIPLQFYFFTILILLYDIQINRMLDYSIQIFGWL